MSNSRQIRLIARRAVLALAILLLPTWYPVSVLCCRFASAAGWLPQSAQPAVASFQAPAVTYIKADLPGSVALRWLIIQSEIAGTRLHPSQR